jgi:pimeloyl-ACP methyl ester carboxylesterase
VPAFGQDVVAVVQQLGLRQVVLIGHSMAGVVIVEAARRLPTAVIGLVGAGAWHDLDKVRTPAEVSERVAHFRTDFVEAVRTLVRTMFVPTSDAALAEDIVTAMSAAPPHIGISVGEEVLGHDRMLQKGLQEVKAPKIAINSAAWRATNMEAAQRHGIEVELMSGVGHFVMMEDPQTFNRLLDEAVKRLVHRGTPP